MQIQEQFNKLNLSICLEEIQLFIGYSKNLKKLYENFTKELVKCIKQYKTKDYFSELKCKAIVSATLING